MLTDVCAAAVSDGAISCAVVDSSSGAPIAGVGPSIDPKALLDALLGRTRLSTPFGVHDGPIPAAVPGELLVLGPERALFAILTAGRQRLVLVAAPPTMSVALGWSLLRRVANAADAFQ